MRDPFFIHPRFKALFDCSGYLFRAQLLIDDFLENVAPEFFIVFQLSFSLFLLSFFRILLGFNGAVCSIAAGIPIKLTDDHRMIAMKQTADTADALFSTQMELNLLSLIEGDFLASHRVVSSLDSA